MLALVEIKQEAMIKIYAGRNIMMRAKFKVRAVSQCDTKLSVVDCPCEPLSHILEKHCEQEGNSMDDRHSAAVRLGTEWSHLKLWMKDKISCQ